MSQADIDVVRGSHEAFRRRDFDAFLEYMDPEIEFTLARARGRGHLPRA